MIVSFFSTASARRVKPSAWKLFIRKSTFLRVEFFSNIWENRCRPKSSRLLISNHNSSNTVLLSSAADKPSKPSLPIMLDAKCKDVSVRFSASPSATSMQPASLRAFRLRFNTFSVLFTDSISLIGRHASAVSHPALSETSCKAVVLLRKACITSSQPSTSMWFSDRSSLVNVGFNSNALPIALTPFGVSALLRNANSFTLLLASKPSAKSSALTSHSSLESNSTDSNEGLDSRASRKYMEPVTEARSGFSASSRRSAFVSRTSAALFLIKPKDFTVWLSTSASASRTKAKEVVSVNSKCIFVSRQVSFLSSAVINSAPGSRMASFEISRAPPPVLSNAANFASTYFWPLDCCFGVLELPPMNDFL
mmetsp:Transcript_43400/g.100021  ORF Transcript_43400/g.100021 Transcript_43400/m.100021 type:complete len:366 (+) Transcript_43400:446-1543(+)